MPKKLTSELLMDSVNKGHFEVREGRIRVADSAPRDLLDLIGRELNLDVGKSGPAFQFPEIPPDLRGIDLGKAIRERKAKEAIEAGWRNAGGDTSRVGTPLGGAISVSMASRNVWRAPFRSGEMEVRFLNNDNGGQQLMQIVTSEMRVRLVGIECQMRQEKADDIIATIGALRVADAATTTVKIPDWPLPSGHPYFTFADGEGQGRLESFDLPLVWGRPIQNVLLTVCVVETDEDDNINFIMDKAAEVIVEKGRELVEEKTGVDAESIVNKKDLEEEVKKKLGDFIKKWLARPDVYDVGHLSISALEVASGPVRKQPYKRGDDSNVIQEWTHDVVVRGRDNGGDTGQYRLFFDVSRVDIYEEIPV